MGFDYVKYKPGHEAWVDYIKGRIKKNKNFIGFISGETGSGKSWTCLSMAEKLDPSFSLERIVFTPGQFFKLINGGTLKKGYVIVWEEVGVNLSNRDWQSSVNKAINQVIQTFRHRNFILLMNAPYMDFVDAATRKLFHAEFETVGIVKKKVVLKGRIIQYNSKLKKFYYKDLRVVRPQEGVVRLQRWGVIKPSSELIKAYEAKKLEYTMALNKKLGAELEKLENPQTKKQLNAVPDEELEEWKRMRASKKTILDIASKFKRHPDFVSKKLAYLKRVEEEHGI